MEITLVDMFKVLKNEAHYEIGLNEGAEALDVLASTKDLSIGRLRLLRRELIR